MPKIKNKESEIRNLKRPYGVHSLLLLVRPYPHLYNLAAEYLQGFSH